MKIRALAEYEVNIHDYSDNSDFITGYQFTLDFIKDIMVGAPINSLIRVDIGSEVRYGEIIESLEIGKVFKQIAYKDKSRNTSAYIHIPRTLGSTMRVYRGISKERISLYFERISPSTIISKIDLDFIELNDRLGDADGLSCYPSYSKRKRVLLDNLSQNTKPIHNDPFSILDNLPVR